MILIVQGSVDLEVPDFLANPITRYVKLASLIGVEIATSNSLP